MTRTLRIARTALGMIALAAVLYGWFFLAGILAD